MSGNLLEGNFVKIVRKCGNPVLISLVILGCRSSWFRCVGAACTIYNILGPWWGPTKAFGCSVNVHASIFSCILFQRIPESAVNKT